MTLEILEAGGLATIQDLGRRGWRKFGLPLSGPMDAHALRASNALVRNSPDAAVLEIGLGEVALRAQHDCVIAVAGVGFEITVSIWTFPLWSSFYVRGGSRISIRKVDGGNWVYLAIAGGFKTKPVLGSGATYLRGNIGGIENGRLVREGDVLDIETRISELDDLAARSLRAEKVPHYSSNPTIEVIMGPQHDHFTEDGLHTFLNEEYSLSKSFDRMGYRLEGPQIKQRGSADLISEGITIGSIQVPANGQPIVIMADGPTTGGYPKIATVTSADLPLLAQCSPFTSKVRFRETTVERAQARYREMIDGLNEIDEIENQSRYAQ